MATPEPREGWFPFDLLRDDFAPSPLDCSRFIEAPAGRHGFLRVKGERFVFEDGAPARFFGVQLQHAYEPETADYLARRLVKQGINVVRYHRVTGITDPEADTVLAYDEDRWRKLDYMLHRLGEAGVYVILDVDHRLRVKPGDKIPGLPKGGSTQFLTFFNEPVIALKRRHMRDVFTHVNAHNGRRYCDDPAICLIEIANEDSLFWHGVDDLDEPFRTELEELFKAWLRGRYGGEHGLEAVWSVEGRLPLAEGEGLDVGQRMAMMPMWQFRQDLLERHPERARRAQDQMRFFLHLERKYFTETRDFLRSIGVKTPLCGTNWRGGGFTTRVHLWGQAEMDYVDRHGYWDYPQGEGNSRWRLATCRFHNLPMVKAVAIGADEQEEDNVANIVLSKAWERVLGKPFTVSEWTCCLPNEYSLEGTGIVAAYGMLQGWEALLQFGYFSPDWAKMLGPGSFDLLANPPQLLQFPAAATMWHRCDVQEGPLVAEVVYGPEDLLEPREDHRPLPWPAAWVGKVGYRFTQGEHEAVIADIAPHWDGAAFTARSATGQLCWNARDGIVTVDAPRTQAVIGFLNAATHRLSSIVLVSDAPFGAVYVTSLEDDKPVEQSERLLVTAVGPARNTGMEYEETDRMSSQQGTPLYQLSSPGREPILLRAVAGRLEVHTQHAARMRAWALDVNGRRRLELPLGRGADRILLTLARSSEAVYYELALS